MPGIGGYQSDRLWTVAQYELILPPYVEPKTFRARVSEAGIGTSTVSRGRLNITTWFDFGSIETTIIVSVLWPPACSSAPMRRMFRRSVPFHGGSDGALATGPMLPRSVSVGPAVSVGSLEPPGEPDASGALQPLAWLSPSPTKTQPSALATSRS